MRLGHGILEGAAVTTVTIADIIDARARDSAERPFVSCGGETVTYGEFAERVARSASALHEMGIARGDKICLFLPNGLPFVLAMFAAARLGAVFVPAHAGFTSREIGYILEHSDAVAVLTDAERQARVEEVREACPRLRHVILDLPRSSSLPPQPTSAEPNDVAAIMYTSGTTGEPKGALLTHRGYMLNATAIAEHLSLSADDVLLCVLPLAHLNAQRSSLLPAALARAHLILEERFSASAFWPTVRSRRVTFFSIMPAIVSILLQQPATSEDRAHHVRLCVTPITRPLLEQFEGRFGIPVVNTYGLTEGMLNVMNFADPALRRPGAIGKPLLPAIHHLRIVDSDENEVPRGVVGEILLQSPAMMTGYYKDAEASALAMRGGWLHTGDLGYLDDEEFLHFAGRRKEIIRRAGENVAPAEIEAVLAAHPGVHEAVVVGVPDPLREEEIKACVILRGGEDCGSVPPAALFEHCAAQLAAFKVPRYLEYRRDFPRTPTLRVQRHKLTSTESEPGTQLFDRAELTAS